MSAARHVPEITGRVRETDGPGTRTPRLPASQGIPAITGVGVFIPSNRVSNEDLVAAFNAHARLDNAQRSRSDQPLIAESSLAFVEKASGVRARYFLEPRGILDPRSMAPRIPERDKDAISLQGEFGVSSARQAIRNAALSPADIDLVICACAHHQRPYPAMAIEIQKALGCTGAAFDLNAACSSAAFALHLAASLVRSGGARNVLVCSPEIMSGHVNFQDRNTHCLYGDASASVVVSDIAAGPARDARLTFEIVKSEIWTSFSNAMRSDFGFLNRAAPEFAHAPDKLLTENGKTGSRHLAVAAGRRIRWFLNDAGLETREVERFWLQQAQPKLIEALMRYIDPEIPAERVPVVSREIGNVGSPGALIAFQRSAESVPLGGHGLMSSFGAGFSVGCLLLRRIS